MKETKITSADELISKEDIKRQQTQTEIAQRNEEIRRRIIEQIREEKLPPMPEPKYVIGASVKVFHPFTAELLMKHIYTRVDSIANLQIEDVPRWMNYICGAQDIDEAGARLKCRHTERHAKAACQRCPAYDKRLFIKYIYGRKSSKALIKEINHGLKMNRSFAHRLLRAFNVFPWIKDEEYRQIEAARKLTEQQKWVQEASKPLDQIRAEAKTPRTVKEDIPVAD